MILTICTMCRVGTCTLKQVFVNFIIYLISYKIKIINETLISTICSPNKNFVVSTGNFLNINLT